MTPEEAADWVGSLGTPPRPDPSAWTDVAWCAYWRAQRHEVADLLLKEAQRSALPAQTLLDELKRFADKCRDFNPGTHIGPLWAVGYTHACASVAVWLDEFAVKLEALSALPAAPVEQLRAAFIAGAGWQLERQSCSCHAIVPPVEVQEAEKKALILFPDLAALPAAPGEPAWQLIETAPKDQTEILVLHGEYMSVVWWDETLGGWLVAALADQSIYVEATHWMPLPALPVVVTREEKEP